MKNEGVFVFSDEPQALLEGEEEKTKTIFCGAKKGFVVSTPKRINERSELLLDGNENPQALLEGEEEKTKTIFCGAKRVLLLAPPIGSAIVCDNRGANPE